jgi:hypothetical protein
LGLGVVVEATDGFARVGEIAVVLVDDDLRHDGDHRDADARLPQGVGQALLDHVAHCALRVGNSGIDGERGQHAGLRREVGA